MDNRDRNNIVIILLLITVTVVYVAMPFLSGTPHNIREYIPLIGK